jgi:hypothetical protein
MPLVFAPQDVWDYLEWMVAMLAEDRRLAATSLGDAWNAFHLGLEFGKALEAHDADRS